MPATDGASTVVDDSASTVDVPIGNQVRVLARSVNRSFRDGMRRALRPFGCFEGLQGAEWTAEEQAWARVADDGVAHVEAPVATPHVPAPAVEAEPRSVTDPTATLSARPELAQDLPTSPAVVHAAAEATQSEDVPLVSEVQTSEQRETTVEERIASAVAAAIDQRLSDLRLTSQPSAGGAEQGGGTQTNVVIIFKYKPRMAPPLGGVWSTTKEMRVHVTRIAINNVAGGRF